jgi:amino acid permease
MSQKLNDYLYKLIVLGIGFFTILLLVCIGLFVANFSAFDPILMVNAVLGSILGLGIAIVAAFHALNIYNQMSKNPTKKNHNLHKKMSDIQQTEFVSQQLIGQQKKIDRAAR